MSCSHHTCTILPLAHLQTINNNRDDCLAVAERTVELLTAMIECLEGKTEADINTKLKGQLEKVGR